MGNINDYGLPEVKRILGVVDNAKDATYLTWLHQAVSTLNNRLDGGMSVAVTGNSYVLSPDATETSVLWNVLATCAVWLFQRDELRKFLADMQGLATISDQVTRMSRAATMRVMKQMVDDARKEYLDARRSYRRTLGTATISMEEIGFRESETSSTS